MDDRVDDNTMGPGRLVDRGVDSDNAVGSGWLALSCCFPRQTPLSKQHAHVHCLFLLGLCESFWTTSLCPACHLVRDPVSQGKINGGLLCLYACSTCLCIDTSSHFLSLFHSDTPSCMSALLYAYRCYTFQKCYQ